MRVLLVGPDYEANLSLQYLSSSLRAAGHEPRLVAFNTAADGPAVLAAARETDGIGLSMSFQVRAREFLDLADAIRRQAPTLPIIAGGHYASCAAAELLSRHPSLDVIVIHEGERTLVDLADLGDELVARAGEVAGVVVRRSGVPWSSPTRPIVTDLETLPRPDRSGPARLLCGVPTAYMMGSRGCVSRCDYCCITTLHRMAPGRRFRQRSAEDVADEMAELFHGHGIRQFVFHDDNFLVPRQEHNRDRIARLGAALDRQDVRDIALVLKCSPRDADREVLATLKTMGLLRLFMGIESSSACGLASIGRRQTVAESERALTTCEALGISTQYTMIILHPEATVATMLSDLAFVDRHPAHPLNYCRAEIYAGTPLEARMLAANRAEGSYLGRTFRYADPRVARIWDFGRDLFAGRCWGQDDLLGSVIRLDHQVAVLGRFFEGRRVRELADSFVAWETDVNVETAAYFRELVLSCDDAGSDGDRALAKLLADLGRREKASRDKRLTELCRLRKALDRFSHASVAIGRRYAIDRAEGWRARAPRHAVAVAVAIGLLGGCPPVHDEGVAEAAPPPLDQRVGSPDGGHPVEVWRTDPGVVEAPPPPLDAGVPRDASSPPGPTGEPDGAPASPRRHQRAKLQSGVGVRHVDGVAEAAPPPIEPTPEGVVVVTGAGSGGGRFDLGPVRISGPGFSGIVRVGPREPGSSRIAVSLVLSTPLRLTLTSPPGERPAARQATFWIEAGQRRTVEVHPADESQPPVVLRFIVGQ